MREEGVERRREEKEGRESTDWMELKSHVQSLTDEQNSFSQTFKKKKVSLESEDAACFVRWAPLRVSRQLQDVLRK